MSRLITFLCLVAAASGCSRGSERAAVMSPTAPSTAAADTTPMGVGGVSGPMDVLFPSRSDSFEFRNQLEAKYQVGLNRPAQQTLVDREGEVVWVQEYMRYRANGCDHLTATQRVFAQIDGNAPGQICAAPADGAAVAFPPRDQALDFRRQLESKYAQLNRSATQTFVDAEGSVIWTQEYLRYRTNSCDHGSSVQKVFSQIDGGGVAATCFVPPCVYRVRPFPQNVPASGGNFVVELYSDSGSSCAWTVRSSASFVTLTSPTGGAGPTLVNYTVAQNFASQRTANIRFDWSGGSASQEVNQAAPPFNVSFLMFDPGKSINSSTECEIRMVATPCTFVASANLPEATTFNWRLVYTYGIDKTITQSGSSSTFTLTEGCGGANSTTDGFDIDVDVTLTVRDTRDNEQTVRSGQGNQPALRLKVFRC